MSILSSFWERTTLFVFNENRFLLRALGATEGALIVTGRVGWLNAIQPHTPSTVGTGRFANYLFGRLEYFGVRHGNPSACHDRGGLSVARKRRSLSRRRVSDILLTALGREVFTEEGPSAPISTFVSQTWGPVISSVLRRCSAVPISCGVMARLPVR